MSEFTTEDRAMLRTVHDTMLVTRERMDNHIKDDDVHQKPPCKFMTETTKAIEVKVDNIETRIWQIVAGTAGASILLLVAIFKDRLFGG